MLILIKVLIVLMLVMLVFLYPPKSWEEKEPEDEQLCIAVHTINNICDINPLDN